MAVSGLAKLIDDYGLASPEGAAWGLIKACFISICEGDGFKQLCIYAGPRGSGRAQQVEAFIRGRGSDLSAYKLLPDRGARPGISTDSDGTFVTLRFSAAKGAQDRMRAFIEELLPQIAPLTEPLLCARCGQPLERTDFHLVACDGGGLVPMHGSCEAEYNAEHSAAEQAAWEKAVAESNAVTGVFGAVIGALFGAILWMIVGKMGYVASVVGFVIAILASKGYDIMKGRPGKVKTVTLTICVILAVLAGTFGTYVWVVHDVYQEQVSEMPIYRQVVSEREFMAQALPAIIEDPEMRGEYLKDAGVGLFFALLGSGGTLLSSNNKPGKRKKRG